MIVTDSVTKPVQQRKPPRKIFQYIKANWDTAREDASTIMNTFLTGNWKQQSVDNNWTQFKSFVLDIISKFVPSKTSSNRITLPWLTPQLRKAINKKNKLYFKARRTKQSDLWTRYKACKRETQ
jgi:hypothetical protein